MMKVLLRLVVGLFALTLLPIAIYGVGWLTLNYPVPIIFTAAGVVTLHFAYDIGKEFIR